MKIHAFIQARMGSTRFPGKVLAPLGGKPVIEYVFDFAKKLPVDQVFLLTSSHPRDDVLIEWANSSGIETAYRGTNLKVASWFHYAFMDQPCDYALRICGDSPFLDYSLAVYLIRKIRAHQGADYYSYETNEKVPAILTDYGLFIEGFRTEIFCRAYEKGLSDEQEEHVTNVFYQNPEKYIFRYLNIPSEITRYSFKMAIDTVDDLDRANILVATLEAQKEPGYWNIAHAVTSDGRLRIKETAKDHD